jgi:hypothetical protein
VAEKRIEKLNIRTAKRRREGMQHLQLNPIRFDATPNPRESSEFLDLVRYLEKKKSRLCRDFIESPELY